MSRGKQKWRRRQEKLRQAAAAQDQQTPESAGEGAPSNLRPSEELGLVGRAIREEWPVTDAVKSETIATVQRIMAKAEEAYPETALAAADKLLRMTAQNIAARKADQPIPPPQPSPAQKHLHQHLHVGALSDDERRAHIQAILEEHEHGPAELPAIGNDGDVDQQPAAHEAGSDDGRGAIGPEPAASEARDQAAAEQPNGTWRASLGRSVADGSAPGTAQ